MNIKINTRHGDLSEATRQKISEKLIKLERFVDRIAEVQVLVNLDQKDSPNVEVAVITDWKKDFRANYSGNDILGSVDQIVDKISQQVKKFKEKQYEHTRAGRPQLEEPVDEEEDEVEVGV